MKHSPILISILIGFAIISCQDPHKHLRENKALNKEVFFGKTSDWITKDTLAQFSGDCEKAFGLTPIERSSAKIEIRIYYKNAFQERFFSALFEKDSVSIELTDCGTVKRNDSLFMLLGNVLSTKRRYERQVLTMMELLPYNFFSPENRNSEHPAMDSGDTYFIQTRAGKIIKTILIDQPFAKVPDNVESRYISNFIKTIEKCYSFNFDDNWKIIDSTAFKN